MHHNNAAGLKNCNNKVSMVVENPVHYNNRFFDTTLIRDNQHACFVYLKQKLLPFGVELHTEDINPIERSAISIFTGISDIGLRATNTSFKYVILMETPGLCPSNWDERNHLQFDRIFTWRKDIVDNKKYFHLRFGYDLRIPPQDVNNDRNKLCTMIVGHKSIKHPLELYSERLAAINWFAQYHPDDLDLFGEGWPQYNRHWFFRNIPFAVLGYLKPFSRVYKGRVVSKAETLKKYRFSICYENMKEIPDYITEKIFDSMSAGCIPVYWGAANIEELVPKNCFIDRRQFSSYGELYNFMVTMSVDQYNEYIYNIREYLKSDQSVMFSAEKFADILCDYILIDLGLKY